LHFDLADQYRLRNSIVHRLDPRVKVGTALAYILVASLTREGAWLVFTSFFALLLLMTWASDLGLTFTLRRSYIAFPFVLAALALPFTTPGVEVARLPGLGWTISAPGLVRFFSILIRSWLAVQVAILLTATTRFSDLLWALHTLRFPRLLVSTIGFMYRYIFVLADEALRLMRARAARSARVAGAPRPSWMWQGKVAGSMVGSLFLRALERSERVYAAMLARGYDGQVRVLQPFRMRSLDWLVLAMLMVVLASPLALDWVY
jgi:cobalt/nickel transport system permease protein